MSLFAASLLFLANATGQRTIDYWMVSDGKAFDGEIIVLVERSTVFNRPDGWTTYSTVTVLNGSRHTTYKSDREASWVNCRTREHVRELTLYYGDDGKLILEKKWTEPRRVVTPGSVTDEVVGFVCGNTAGATQLPGGINPIDAADAVYARKHKHVAKTPVPPTTPPRSPAAAPAKAQPGASVPTPGLGENSWKIISLDSDAMVMYAPSTVKSGKASGQAWFTVIYAKPRVLGEVKGVVTAQLLYGADCIRNTKRGLQVATYDANDRLIFSGADPNAQPTSTQAGTVGRTEVDIACGRPVKHWVADTYTYDVPNMRGIYMAQQALQR